MVEVSSTTRLPLKLLWAWARVRFNEHNDKSPLIIAILNDPFCYQHTINQHLSPLGDDGSDAENEDDDVRRSSRSSNGVSNSARLSRSQSISTTGGASDSSLYVIANYWNLPVLTVHAMKNVESGLKISGDNFGKNQVIDRSIPAQQTQYIPSHWRQFLSCITNGLEYKHDEHLYRLLCRVGIPYVDMSISETAVKYHYLIDVLSFPTSSTIPQRSVSHASISISLSYSGTAPTTPTQSMSRLATFTSAAHDSNQSFNQSQPSMSMQSFNMPSFNVTGQVNSLNTVNPMNGQQPDPHLQQSIWHRAVPGIFKDLVEHDPLRKNLYRTISSGNYISESWFYSLLKSFPFLYWAGQAYVKSMSNGMEIVRSLRDGFDEATGEIRGDLALKLLTDHCCKLSETTKEPCAQIYYLIIVISKVLTNGANMDIKDRSLFMNLMFQYLGDGNKVSSSDLTEFVLSGDWITFLNTDLSKATKGIMRRFKETQWLPVNGQGSSGSGSGSKVSPLSINSQSSFNINAGSVANGVASWRSQFITTASALESLNDYITGKEEDSCEIM